ncbi:MAG: dienelactone hydrolase family protein [Oleibacter sp.]|nr:dienelactone hydrolase family protein [Thalassolituus sp.]
MTYLVMLGLFLCSPNGLAKTCQYEVNSDSLSAKKGYREGVFFYPCESNASLPAISLSGGYNNTYRNLQWMAEALAAANYIVLAVTPIDINGNVEQWTTAHLAAQNTFLAVNRAPEHTLFQRIDEQSRGMAGFSMGGGGVLQAGSALGNQVKAIAAFAPFLLAEDRPNIAVSAPTLIIAGNRDLLVTNESVNEIETQLKKNASDYAVAVVNNGRHQDWYRAEFTKKHDSFIHLTLAWFNLHLKGIANSADILMTEANTMNKPESFYQSFVLKFTPTATSSNE